MTAIPARVAGVREIIAVCPRPEPVVLAAAEAAGVTRLFRLGGAHAIAALAYWHDVDPARGQDRRAGQQVRRRGESATSRPSARIDMQAGPSEILILSERGRPDWLAADLIAQAEHDPDARALLITSQARLAQARRDARSTRRCRTTARRAPRSRAHGGIIVAASPAEAIALANRMAPEHLVVDDETAGRGGALRGRHLHRRVHRAGRRRLRHRIEPRAADRRRRAVPRRAERRRLRARRLGAARDRRGLRGIAQTIVTLAHAEGLTAHARRSRATRCPAARPRERIDPQTRGSRVPTAYHRLQRRRRDGALRLHLNENTAGCSPKVLEALARAAATDVAFYPDYDAVVAESRRLSGRATRSPAAHQRPRRRHPRCDGRRRSCDGSRWLSTAGRDRPDAGVRHVRVSVRGRSAARVVRVPPRGDFEFPLDGVLAAHHAANRLVFITSPNNPTGVRVRSTTSIGVAARDAAGAARVRRRGVPRLLRRHGPAAAAIARRTSSSAGRSRRRTAWRRCAPARSSARAETLEPLRR